MNKILNELLELAVDESQYDQIKKWIDKYIVETVSEYFIDKKVPLEYLSYAKDESKNILKYNLAELIYKYCEEITVHQNNGNLKIEIKSMNINLGKL